MKVQLPKNTSPKTELLLVVFIVLSIASALIPYFKIDILITNTIQNINSVVFTQIMWFVSNTGNQPIMIILVGVISSFLFFFGMRKEAVISSLSAAGSALSGSVIKMLVDRPRPEANLVHVSVWLSDKSYPSNHVLVFTVFFGFLLYLLFHKAKQRKVNIFISLIFILLIASIGISRIYLGAHWASDVLGGYLFGILWLIVTIRLYNSSYYGKR